GPVDLPRLRDAVVPDGTGGPAEPAGDALCFVDESHSAGVAVEHVGVGDMRDAPVGGSCDVVLVECDSPRGVVGGVVAACERSGEPVAVEVVKGGGQTGGDVGHRRLAPHTRTSRPN